MDLFTYLMAKNDHNTSVHGDLFSYLLGKGQSQTQTISGVTIYIPDAKKLVSFMMTKESTQDGEPTPDNPVPVNVVEGYRNLFDKDNAEIGRIAQDGTIATISGYFTSQFIKVNSNTNYTKNSQTADAYHRFAFYTSNDENSFISVSNNNTITTPSNCQYLRFCGIDTEIDSTQLVEDDQELPYVPYGNNYILYKQVGKNLFDKTKALDGKRISSSTGEVNNVSDCSCSDYIYVKDFSKVILSGTTITYANNGAFYDENKAFISGFNSTILKNGLTVPSGVTYLRFSTLTEDINTTMLENGSTATEYEAYKESIIPIPLNNNIIAGIGDYKDELKVDKSGNVFINKKTGKIIFDGTENWIYSKASNNNNRFRLITDIDSVTDILSNYFHYGLTNSYGEIFWNSGSIWLLYDTDNVNTFKTWLSTHNTEVYYPLETPELIDLQTTVDISLFKGVNNISNSEDGYMTIEYK